MAFLEDVHLPRPDPKPTAVNENRDIDFSGRSLKTHVNNRAENSLLTPELFLRYFATAEPKFAEIEEETVSRPTVCWTSHSCTLLAKYSSASALSAGEAAGDWTFLHLQ